MFLLFIIIWKLEEIGKAGVSRREGKRTKASKGKFAAVGAGKKTKERL